MVQHIEGEANSSRARQEWRERTRHAPTDLLLGRDADAFLHQSLSSPCLSAIVRAEGIWIEDTTGRRYMDFHGNSAHHIGYGHPRLKAAIAAQMDMLPFAPRRFTCEPAVELAERLSKAAPGWRGKVLFTTGGSDANEVALKIARAATGRFKTISFWDSFHGAGFGAASVGGEATFRSHIAGPLLAGTEHVAPFGCNHCAYGHANADSCGMACANMVSYVLEREGDVAAVIARPELDVCGAFAIGHYTHEKNPVTTRAALTTLDIIADEGLVERAAKLGAHALGRLQDLKAGSALVSDVRGRGLMFGAEIGPDAARGHEVAERIYYRCLADGLSFKISAGNVLTLSPPLTITLPELDQALDIVARAVQAE